MECWLRGKQLQLREAAFLISFNPQKVNVVSKRANPRKKRDMIWLPWTNQGWEALNFLYYFCIPESFIKINACMCVYACVCVYGVCVVCVSLYVRCMCTCMCACTRACVCMWCVVLSHHLINMTQTWHVMSPQPFKVVIINAVLWCEIENKVWDAEHCCL